MKKYENFVHALKNLEDIYKYEEPYDNVVLTGLVALYEICFEQSWKAMKEIMEDSGIDETKTGSPRQVLKTAYKAGMIEDENEWMEALASRNNVAHAYKKEIAIEIIRKTKAQYYNMFVSLKNTLESDWIDLSN